MLHVLSYPPRIFSQAAQPPATSRGDGGARAAALALRRCGKRHAGDKICWRQDMLVSIRMISLYMYLNM